MGQERRFYRIIAFFSIFDCLSKLQSVQETVNREFIISGGGGERGPKAEKGQERGKGGSSVESTQIPGIRYFALRHFLKFGFQRSDPIFIPRYPTRICMRVAAHGSFILWFFPPLRGRGRGISFSFTRYL